MRYFFLVFFLLSSAEAKSQCMLTVWSLESSKKALLKSLTAFLGDCSNNSEDHGNIKFDFAGPSNTAHVSISKFYNIESYSETIENNQLTRKKEVIPILIILKSRRFDFSKVKISSLEDENKNWIFER